MGIEPAYMQVAMEGRDGAATRDAIREIFGRGLFNIDFVELDDDPGFSLEMRALPGVSLLRGWNSPNVARTHDVSRLGDELGLAWSHGGHGGINQRGRTTVAGEFAFFDSAEPIVGKAYERVRHVNVKVDRSRLLALVPDAEDRVMKPMPLNSLPGHLLDTYLDAIAWPAESSPELDHVMGLHIVDLVALVIGAAGDAGQMAAERGGRAARFQSVKRWLLERLDRPALSVNDVARAHRISPRSVQYLFETHGATFSAWLLEQRLALAERRLTDPRCDRQSISSIAFGCGFGDLSHFNHNFRRRFGETPTEMRVRAGVTRLL